MTKHSLRIAFASLVTGVCLAASPVRAEDPAPSVEKLPAAKLFARFWSRPGGDMKTKAATLIGDTLYLVGADSGLTAISVKDGQMLWKHLTKDPIDWSLTERGDNVYFVEGGRLVVVNKTNGREISSAKNHVSSMTTAYPGEGTLLIGTAGNRAYGVSDGTGDKVWNVGIDGVPLASTWDGQNTVYMLTTKGTLFAIAIPVRQMAWRYEFKRPQCSAPTFYDDTVYIGNQDYFLYAFDSISGAERFRVSLSAPLYDAPVATHDHVYATTVEGILYAVDLKSHEIIWHSAGGGRVLTTTANHVVCLRKKENRSLIVTLDAVTGKPINEMSADEYQHFVGAPSDGVFYAVSEWGKVLAIGDREMAKQKAEKREPEPAATK